MDDGEISAPVTRKVASGERVACQPVWRGVRLSARANNGASADGAGVPAGSSSWNLASSGTQISLQTSQFASACSDIDPGLLPGVILTGSRSSPVKA